LKSHARRVVCFGRKSDFRVLANTLLGKIRKGDLAQGFTGREVMRKTVERFEIKRYGAGRF
jgi:hypothetical protein